jgi:phosphate transport system permease protein
VSGEFGALPFIWGTLYSSILALLIATPIALGIAVFISELSPSLAASTAGVPHRTSRSDSLDRLRLVGHFRDGAGGAAARNRPARIDSSTAVFQRSTARSRNAVSGADIGDDGDSVHLVHLREVLKSVPAAQREGAYALGATRFEAIRAALFYARTGIVGGAMLGLAERLAETMAVTMVIGNNPKVSLSLFAPQYTMAAVIANEFTEAADDLYLAALIEIGLVLFVITLIVNSLSRLLIWSMARTASVVAEPEAEPAAA